MQFDLAFLQDVEIDRDVFIRPSREENPRCLMEVIEGDIWVV